MRRGNLAAWAAGSLTVLGLTMSLGTGAARADLRTTYAAGPIVYPGADPDFPQQVAVNKNIGSPYYGYVYVADYGGGVGPHKLIHIWKPTRAADGTGADAYEDTGLSITPSGAAQFDPFAVAVGSDDTVWIGNPSSGTIDTAPPVPTSPATTVTATTQVTAAGFVRGLYVTGPVTGAIVVAAGGAPSFVSKYAVSAVNPGTTGVFNQIYTTAITGLNSGPYGPAMDTAGNVYIVTKTNAPGADAFIKLDTTGAVVPFPALIPPNYISTSDLSSAGFVADPTYPGGGYLYSINRTFSTAGDMGIRYDLSGNYLDGYGPTTAPAPANYTVLALARNNTYGTTDDLGNVIQKVSFEGNGAYQKVIKRAPFVVATVDANSAAAAVKSSPTAVDGVVYFGADDGKLYAYTTDDGNPVAGFPVDVNAALGATVTIQSRPSVYITSGGKGIYFTTDRGDICRVNEDGTGFAAYSAFGPGSGNVGTPAVTPDGTVYAGVDGANGLYVLKLNPDMTFSASSPQLGPPSGTISSVAVDGNNVYVGLTGGTGGDIVVLKSSDLTPQAAGVAGGEGVTAPPFVNGLNAYVGTLAGNFYKVNSVTFAPDPTFGALNAPATPGRAAVGEPLPGSPFNDGATFYIGAAGGKVWQVDETTGAFNVLYDTGNAAAVIPGVVVNRDSSTLAFGTDVPGPAVPDPHTGVFYQVPTDVISGPVNAQVFRGYGAFGTTPTLDRATGRFLIGSDDKNVYAFSSR